jgi:Domain of unknown function (DUF4873)
MEKYRGPAIVEQNGREISVDCSIVSRIDSPSGGADWSGQLIGPVPANSLQPGSAALRLATGGDGAIIIDQVNPATGQATFTGEGDPPST